MARDAYSEAIEELARLMRRRFARNPRRAFVVLAAEVRSSRTCDQETQRLPALRSA